MTIPANLSFQLTLGGAAEFGRLERKDASSAFSGFEIVK
jgi:hypothetical protein